MKRNTNQFIYPSYEYATGITEKLTSFLHYVEK